VLIVEDDPAAVTIFTQILEDHGYRVQSAPDTESGLRGMEGNSPAAVLVDLHLPMADGIEFLRRLRASSACARVPVAVVTGDYFVDEDIARELEVLGAHVHFKPLWEDDLLTLVDMLIHS
jgi:DNA-binding response OmpR family regulator